MIENNKINHTVWWRNGYVWLIIAGPAVVVVASFITFYLAVSRPNEIVSEDSYKRVGAQSLTEDEQRKVSSSAPAQMGRNHAATGIVPLSK